MQVPVPWAPHVAHPPGCLGPPGCTHSSAASTLHDHVELPPSPWVTQVLWMLAGTLLMEAVLECSCCLLDCASSLSCSSLGNGSCMKAMVMHKAVSLHCVVSLSILPFLAALFLCTGGPARLWYLNSGILLFRLFIYASIWDSSTHSSLKREIMIPLLPSMGSTVVIRWWFKLWRLVNNKRNEFAEIGLYRQDFAGYASS